MAGHPLKPGPTPTGPSGAPITPVDTALYTIDMLESLRRMADRQGHGILAHLLELAQAEARMLARAPKG
jgi:hypothetical protein